MMHSLARVLPAALTVALATGLLHAAEPTFWQVSTEADLLAGEAEALSIDAQGRLTLGPAVVTIYETRAPFLWNLVTGDDGRLYVGSGNDGQVYQVDADGQATVRFDADELEVHALARGPDGALYAGTSPGGRIYRLGDDGTASVFFDPDSEYIWALAVDAAGTVFAATGEPGDVYRIEADGTGAIFYQTQATHAMTLALDEDGAVLVGTASPGRIFRLDAAGRPFVLLDSPYNEIHRLRLTGNGTIYATAQGVAGASSQPSRGNGQAATTVTPGTTATVAVDASAATLAAQPSSAQAASTGAGAGAVYRVLPGGGWDRIWQSRTDSPYDVLAEADGSVLLATGNDGKIFRLAGDPVESALVTELAAEQVTALARDADGALLLASANPGRIVRLSAGLADTGTYLSAVRDAGEVATWGNISWQGAPGGGRLEIFTRSGNTGTPDETWSDWSEPYADPIGTPIVSPRARFIQWRASLTRGADPAPVLDSVTTAYLPRNTRPRVASVTLHPPGTVFQQTFPSVPGIAGFEDGRPERELAAISSDASGAPSLGRREYQQGLLTFVWQGEDDDQDELRYTVQYRRETDTDWAVLRDGLRDPILVWDTTSVPNGRYILRIVASDAPSNSPATRLTGRLDSDTFAIDNTAPVIEVISVARGDDTVRVTFVVRDDDSAVQGAAYSLDGNRWEAVYPVDGIADSRTERFELELPTGMPAQGVVLRATDALSNTATASATLPPELR